MRFQVPQFTEVEDKIFGPLTLKQLVYLAGGVGAIVVLFYLLPSFIAFILMIPVAGLALALTFYKVNNRPFINVMEAFFKYTFNEKLYIWKKNEQKPKTSVSLDDLGNSIKVPKLSQSKLKDLTWTLDVKKEIENPILPPEAPSDGAPSGV